MRKLESKFVIAAALLVASAPASAQGVIAGVVREDSSGKPLAGAEITIEGEKQAAHTDSAGRYAVIVSSGMHVANVRMAGYQPLKLRVIVRKDTANGDADLVPASPAAQQLAAVNVNAKTRTAGAGRDGFGLRRSQGIGKFIDSVQLRSREEQRLSDVLRELTGVRIVQTTNPMTMHTELNAVSPIRESPQPYTAIGGIPSPQMAQCYVTVYFDGTAVYRSGTSDPPIDFSRDFPVSSLESVEYYKSAAETPQQYGGGSANCGVLLLWSRRK